MVAKVVRVAESRGKAFSETYWRISFAKMLCRSSRLKLSFHCWRKAHVCTMCIDYFDYASASSLPIPFSKKTVKWIQKEKMKTEELPSEYMQSGSEDAFKKEISHDITNSINREYAAITGNQNGPLM